MLSPLRFPTGTMFCAAGAMLEEDRRQREAEHRFQTERLNRLPEELAKEPDRIRAIYQVQATRVEPVGLVYLWPVGA